MLVWLEETPLLLPPCCRGAVNSVSSRCAEIPAAYTDIDSRVAVALMRNRFDAHPTAVTAIDWIVKEET